MTPVDCSVHSVTTLSSYEESRELEEGELELGVESITLSLLTSDKKLC